MLHEPFLLDHRLILFNLVRQQQEKVNYESMDHLIWTFYQEELQDKFCGFLNVFGTVEDTEICGVSATGHCLFT
jgi:hypothetical protein